MREVGDTCCKIPFSHLLPGHLTSFSNSPAASGTLWLVEASSFCALFLDTVVGSVQSRSGSMLQTLRFTENLSARRKTWVQSLGQEDPLEKGMAAHQGISVRGTPWTEEPGGLQSTGSQRVGHD